MVELSSLDLRHLVQELSVLNDAFVDKAYQTGPKEFLIRLRHKERGRFNLVIRPGAWAALADEPPETPEQPSSLAMALRKRIANARVRRVRQHEFDRVLVFDLERGGDPFNLVAELFGQGNLVVVGGDGRIDLAWRNETFRHRVIRKGEPFKFPPARPGPENLTAAELAARAKASKRDLVRFLAVEAGLGGDLAESSLATADVAKDQPAAQTPDADFAKTLDALREILDRPPEPRLVAGDGVPRFQGSRLRPDEDEAQRFPTLSAAILAAAQAQADVEAEEEEVDEEHERLVRQKQHQEQGIQRLQEEAAEFEEAAEAIYKRYQDFEALLARIREAVAEHGWNTFQAEATRGDAWPEVKAVDPADKRVRIAWEGQTVEVDPAESVETNASAAFDQAKDVRTKIEGAREALADTQRLIRRRKKRQVTQEKTEAKQEALSRRTFWFMAYRWCYTTEGLLMIAGRDATTNEKLVKKHMKPGDVYAHADVHGAPSTVLKTEGVDPEQLEASLEELCRFAATFSKAFNQFASTDAYWVTPEQVTKTPRSGEFVPKGGFIIRGSRNYRKDLPLEAGVGIVHLDDQGGLLPPGTEEGHRQLMAGPWVSVKVHARPALRVVRGERKPSDVAKEISRRLGVPLDAVAAALPSASLRWEEPE